MSKTLNVYSRLWSQIYIKKKIKFVKFESKAYWQGGSHMSIEIEMMQINSFIYLP